MDLDTAYSILFIEDRTMADEDVVVACYRHGSEPLDWRSSSALALESIASARQSRFLRFMVTMLPHLNDKNVSVLAKKFSAESSTSESVTIESSPIAVCLTPVSGEETNELEEAEMDEFGEHDNDSDEDGEEDTDTPKSPSSSEAEISSTDEMVTDSDFSEEVEGVYYDRITWRCEECGQELVDSKCPLGHRLKRCTPCGWQLVNGSCPRCHALCELCFKRKIDGECRECEAAEESEEEDTIVYDEMNGVWRCIYCQWEVEADNSEDGNCHCLNNRGEAHYIDLSECLDYEPADSDSCASRSDESSDSEPDSEDERFIDDSKIPIEGFTPVTDIGTRDLAALYPAFEIPGILKAAGIAKAEQAAHDKENVKPAPTSDDVEIIDVSAAAATAMSNIVNCDFMNI
ncbi:hypothetical protein MMC28_002742 [Mycoblastus sanguinarius]|nr:hypothetical protein [Mycoblastus sanguinarius]